MFSRGDFIEVTDDAAARSQDAPRRFFFVAGVDMRRFVGYPLPVQTGPYADAELPLLLWDASPHMLIPRSYMIDVTAVHWMGRCTRREG